MNSVFSLTFNSNGAELSEEHLKACLEGSSSSSIVVLAFQEYDFAPARQRPEVPFVFEGPSGNMSVYCRQRGEATTMKDEERMEIISRLLGPRFELVCDVAMGETPGVCSVDNNIPELPTEGEAGVSKKKKKGKTLEWYGFIRLIVYAKSQAGNAFLCGDNTDEIATSVVGSEVEFETTEPVFESAAALRDQVVTCVVPTGEKLSGGGAPSSGTGGQGELVSSPYADGRSPDKGGVIAYFPRALRRGRRGRSKRRRSRSVGGHVDDDDGGGGGDDDGEEGKGLVVVCAHLCGTNKYGVSESVFDALRLQQLERLDQAARFLVSNSDPHPTTLSTSISSDSVASPPSSSHSSSPASPSSSSASSSSSSQPPQDLLSSCLLLVCGDLNFRVESPFTSKEDKCHKGKDFHFVFERASPPTLATPTATTSAPSDGGTAVVHYCPSSSSFAQHLGSLMSQHDRLRQHLNLHLPNNGRRLSKEDADAGRGSSELATQGAGGCRAGRVPLLAGCVDAVGDTVLATAAAAAGSGGVEQVGAVAPTHGQLPPPVALLPPTFTFAVGASHPRSYKDKRTPSWTDRVLVRGLGPLLSCASVKQCMCSDHEPVVVVFAQPPTGSHPPPPDQKEEEEEHGPPPIEHPGEEAEEEGKEVARRSKQALMKNGQGVSNARGSHDAGTLVLVAVLVSVAAAAVLYGIARVRSRGKR